MDSMMPDMISLLKFSVAAAPFKHTDLRQQKDHKSFKVFPCLVVICSKPFDVTMVFTWTFLQSELHSSSRFQGSYGVSLLSFHQGTALTLLSLPFLVLSTGRKFLGKGRRAQGTHSWEQSAVGAPWDDGSWTGGQLLQGWVEWPLLPPEKPFLASCRELGQASPHCPFAQITDLMKNFHSLNGLCN